MLHLSRTWSCSNEKVPVIIFVWAWISSPSLADSNLRLLWNWYRTRTFEIVFFDSENQKGPIEVADNSFAWPGSSRASFDSVISHISFCDFTQSDTWFHIIDYVISHNIGTRTFMWFHIISSIFCEITQFRRPAPDNERRAAPSSNGTTYSPLSLRILHFHQPMAISSNTVKQSTSARDESIWIVDGRWSTNVIWIHYHRNLPSLQQEHAI